MENKARYLLEARHIVKVFGELRANDDVSLRIAPGEIHALLGENGAGKSTLVKIIYGALQPTSGELFWDGKPVTIANPAAARRLGIGMVHTLKKDQHRLETIWLAARTRGLGGRLVGG